MPLANGFNTLHLHSRLTLATSDYKIFSCWSIQLYDVLTFSFTFHNIFFTFLIHFFFFLSCFCFQFPFLFSCDICSIFFAISKVVISSFNNFTISPFSFEVIYLGRPMQNVMYLKLKIDINNYFMIYIYLQYNE